MNYRDSGGDVSGDGSHTSAAEAFVTRSQSRFGDEIETVIVFGSTVRGETDGAASDVDVLVVLSDDANHDPIAETLREIAYDVMLEYGPVVELHLMTDSEFERLRERRNPFVQSVVHEGRSYG